MRFTKIHTAVEGIVDTEPSLPILAGSLATSADPGSVGDVMREQFAVGATSDLYVVRTNLLNHPDDFLPIAEDFRPFVKIGDRVEVRNSRKGAEVLTINGTRSFNRPRTDWFQVQDSMPDQAILRLRLGRILRLTGAGIGTGDICVVIAPPNAGKTWFIKDLLAALRPEYVPVVILTGERRKEIEWFTGVKELFAVCSTESPSRKVRMTELGAHRAMRLAEEGKQVVVCLDSVTRLASEGISMLPAPAGLGTKSGGTNPLALDAVQTILGIAKRAPSGCGSITIVATILDRGDAGDQLVINQARSTSTVQVALSSAAASRRVFPALDFEPVTIRSQGRTVTFRGTGSRTQEKWYPLSEQSNQLAERLARDSVNSLEAFYARLGSGNYPRDGDLFESY